MASPRPDSHDDPPPTPRWSFPSLSLTVIVLLGALLRCAQVHESLWLDELHTSWVVAGSWSEVAPRAAAGNQSPLYFYGVWTLVQLCGQHEWSLRLLSLVAGTALIVATWYLLRLWTQCHWMPLLGALLVALHRDCIFFAQEARPYALLQLSVVGHAAIFVQLLQGPTRLRRTAFVAGALWLFYLHYTAFLFLAAEGICVLMVLPWRRLRVAYTLPQAACDALLIALLLLPAATHVAAIAQHRDSWSRFVRAWPLPPGVTMAAICYGFLPAGALAGGRLRQWKLSRPSEMRDTSTTVLPLIWSACWMTLPPLITWLTTALQLAPLLMVRYLVASLVGAIAFSVVCLSRAQGRFLRWGLSALLVVATVWYGGMIRQWSYDGRIIGDRNENWQAALTWLSGQLQKTALPVFLCPNLLEDLQLQQNDDEQLVQYCLFPLDGIYDLPAADRAPLPTTGNAMFNPAQRQLIAQRRGAWVIVRGPAVQPVIRSLQQSLRQQSVVAHVEQQQRFGGVTVVRLGAE